MKTFNSDKPLHAFAGKSYIDVYEAHLATIEVQSLLEIGVYRGESLKMWRHAFPGARIVGLDIDPDCERVDGCEVVIGDQGDTDLLDSLGEFDVVVDDGSHINSLTVKSFYSLWPHVRPNGMYAIEDLDCSYMDLTEPSKAWPGMEHVTEPRRNDRRDLNNLLFYPLIRELDGAYGDVCEVQFTSKLCVIRKVP